MDSGPRVTLSPPSPPPQSLLAMSPEKRKLATQEVRAAEPLLEEQATESPYTLEEFSYQFFRYTFPTPKAARRLRWQVHGRGYRERKAAATVRDQTGPEKASAQALKTALSLAGPQTRRPSAGPQCLWRVAEAICGPTPQSHCASRCSNVSMKKPNFGMQPARSSLISFLPAYLS